MDGKVNRNYVAVLQGELTPSERYKWLTGMAYCLAENANDVQQRIEAGEKPTFKEMADLAQTANAVIGLLQVVGFEAGNGVNDEMENLHRYLGYLNGKAALERIREAIFGEDI